MRMMATITRTHLKSKVFNKRNVGFFAVLFTYVALLYHVACIPKMAPIGEGTQDTATTEIHIRTRDIDHCKALLTSNGTWFENQWWPVGSCSIHRYSKRDLESCMKNRAKGIGFNHLAVVGDSRARDTFMQMLSYFKPWTTKSRIHEDLTWTSQELNLKLAFHWITHLDDSYADLLATWGNQAVGFDGRPNLVISSFGSWMIEEWVPTTSKRIRDALKKYSFSKLYESITADGNTLFIWKPQDPARRGKFYPWTDNYDFYLFNKVLREDMHELGENSIIWESSVGIAEHYLNDICVLGDGLHYSFPGPCQDLNVQVLMNVYCNKVMRFDNAEELCCN